MRKNYRFENPKCDVKTCPCFGKTMEHVDEYLRPRKGGKGKLVIHVFVCRPRESRRVSRGPMPGRHYAYRALPNWSPLSRVGTGHYVGTDIETCEALETELTRKRGSSLMPEGQSCPECGGEGELQGPNHSKRLGEPVWILRCQRGHKNIYWKRNEKLELLPPKVLSRFRSRNQSGLQFPRCDRPKCKGFGRAMNAQHKQHSYDEGSCEILHCRCRYADRPHDVFLVLPNMELATKEGPGLYSWADSKGEVHRTIPYKRAPKKRARGRARGYVAEDIAARMTFTAYYLRQGWSRHRIARALYPSKPLEDAKNLFRNSVWKKHRIQIQEKMQALAA